MGIGIASRADVSRLFGRAAFGATAADLDRWTGRPYDDVVDVLLGVPDLASRPVAPDEARRLEFEHITRTGPDDGALLDDAQGWWLERMRTTSYPLEERMVLFWHDHWATAWRPNYPDIGMLVEQNQTLRRHALGNFRTMCEAMTLDPAMLFWLDGARNRVGAPNENYAREFFELFTLGTIPQIYKERDIREAARALTGWTCDPSLRAPQFEPGAHDTGTKRVLARTITDMGPQEYKAIVAVALETTIAPLFIAWRLVLNFAHVPPTTSLLVDPSPLVTAVAETLRASDWDIAAAMRTMLLHDDFTAPAVSEGRQTVRQPIELVVGACKALETSADRNDLMPLLTRMGQVPFDPPNVGGWPSNREWLSPLTALGRYDLGLFASDEVRLRESLLPTVPRAGDLDGWAARFGLAGFSSTTRAALDGYLRARPLAPEEELRAGVVALIVSSPDWMVM